MNTLLTKMGRVTYPTRPSEPTMPSRTASGPHEELGQVSVFSCPLDDSISVTLATRRPPAWTRYSDSWPGSRIRPRKGGSGWRKMILGGSPIRASCSRNASSNALLIRRTSSSGKSMPSIAKRNSGMWTTPSLSRSRWLLASGRIPPESLSGRRAHRAPAASPGPFGCKDPLDSLNVKSERSEPAT